MTLTLALAVEDGDRNPCLFEAYLIDNKQAEKQYMIQCKKDIPEGKRRFKNKVFGTTI